jgi:nitrite reductase/ring-hydroxylating ferredoxin subunit
VLSDLPIGLWTAATFFDLLDMDAAATLMSASGSAAAVATAVTGIADWTVTHGRDRRLAFLHGLLNATALLVQLDSLYHRIRRRRGAARGLGLAGWLLGLGAAYFGGELVFGRGLMVDHNAWASGPEQWTPAFPAANLAEGKPQKVELDGGHPILLYREAGQVYAMEETCSHAGGPLSEGKVNHGVVTCPWHGSQFRLTDGSLRRSPATFPQLRLETRVNAGQVEVRGRQG